MGNIASYIDHTLLNPDSTKEQIIQICKEAETYEFATVCVHPYWVSLVSKQLKETNVGITTVIGFPLGATTTFSKTAETRDAIASGATEIDMVINIGALKSGDTEAVYEDIEQVVKVVGDKAIVKVIIETALLTNEEKEQACEIAKQAGAHFVKTSTGFNGGGATVEDISLMRRVVGPKLGVKASGGIRDLDTAKAMIDAGATRIGASSSISIIKGDSDNKTGY